MDGVEIENYISILIRAVRDKEREGEGEMNILLRLFFVPLVQ